MELSNADISFRHADTEDDMRACWPLMRELRPHIVSADSMIERVRRMRAENYRILGLWRGAEVPALGGYRLQENLIYGRFLYLDDLVTRESARCKGWGEHVLGEVTRLAEEANCAKLILDTGLSNVLAQRFYVRQGMVSSAMRFSKSLSLRKPLQDPLKK